MTKVYATIFDEWSKKGDDRRLFFDNRPSSVYKVVWIEELANVKNYENVLSTCAEESAVLWSSGQTLIYPEKSSTFGGVVDNLIFVLKRNIGLNRKILFDSEWDSIAKSSNLKTSKYVIYTVLLFLIVGWVYSKKNCKTLRGQCS